MRDQLRRLHELAGSPTWDRLKEYADAAGHSVSRAALAAVPSGSGGAPRWATVEAFIDGCAHYAKARKRPLPDCEIDMLTWKAQYDRAYPRQRRNRSPNLTGRERLAEPMASPGIFDYDVRQDELFPLGVWSLARKLEPSRLLTENVSAENRPMQQYLDRAVLAAAVEAHSRIASGATVYLTGFRIANVTLDGSIALLEQFGASNAQIFNRQHFWIIAGSLINAAVLGFIGLSVIDYLSGAVPSSLAVNIVVVSSENDELLCVERSAAVDSAVGWWTIGVFETMKQSDRNRPGAPEDLYGLAARGLNEELGLQPGDHHPIQISWIGLYRPILRGHVVAVLKLKISKEEVHARVRAAHSGYEHAAIDWIPLRPSLVQVFNQAARIMHPNKVGSTIEVHGRTWIEQSRLAIQEAWRFRNAIEN